MPIGGRTLERPVVHQKEGDVNENSQATLNHCARIADTPDLTTIICVMQRLKGIIFVTTSSSRAQWLASILPLRSLGLTTCLSYRIT